MQLVQPARPVVPSEPLHAASSVSGAAEKHAEVACVVQPLEGGTVTENVHNFGTAILI